MFRIIKQVFFALLSFAESLADFSKFKTCISLNNQPCMTRSTLIDLNSDNYNQGLHYYPLIINLERCRVSCNSLDDSSGQICALHKLEDVNFSVFNNNERIKNTNETYIM